MAEQNKMNIEIVIHIVYDFYIHSNDIAYHIILKVYSSVRRPSFETLPRDFIMMTSESRTSSGTVLPDGPLYYQQPPAVT